MHEKALFQTNNLLLLLCQEILLQFYLLFEVKFVASLLQQIFQLFHHFFLDWFDYKMNYTNSFLMVQSTRFQNLVFSDHNLNGRCLINLLLFADYFVLKVVQCIQLKQFVVFQAVHHIQKAQCIFLKNYLVIQCPTSKLDQFVHQLKPFFCSQIYLNLTNSVCYL